MSGKLSTAVMFVSILFIALAANYSDENSFSEDSSRAPASVRAMNSKERRLGGFLSKPTLRHTEKVRGPLDAKIELVGAKAEKIGDVFVLRGVVSSRSRIENATFQWSVPAGVELINGAVSGELMVVSPDQPAFVELTLRKMKDDNAQVHLMAGAVNGKTTFGDSAQYNTDIQEMLDTDRAAVKKSLEAGSADKGSQPAIKVMH